MRKTIRAIALVLMAAMLAVPVFAGFTPSVTQKPAPEVAPMTDSKGNEVAGIIRDAEGKEVEGVSEEYLVVIPMSEAEESSPDVQDKLEKAYTQIAEAKDLTKVAPDLKDALTEINKDRKEPIVAKELVVRDLVYVYMTPELEAKVKDGGSIAVKFELDLQEGETLIVMQQIGDKWIVIYGEDIEIDEDGSAIVNLAGVGPVAFIVK